MALNAKKQKQAAHDEASIVQAFEASLHDKVTREEALRLKEVLAEPGRVIPDLQKALQKARRAAHG